MRRVIPLRERPLDVVARFAKSEHPFTREAA